MLAWVAATGGLRADDAPWDFERPMAEIPLRHLEKSDDPALSSNPLQRGFGNLLSFYQNVLSPLDGPKCPHYPTCSQYSREAVGKYGAFWGILMTADRLTREYPGLLESGHYDLIYKGQWRSYDPPENEWLWPKTGKEKP